jgi:transposase
LQHPPGRKLRPQDKGAVERAFGVIRQLLLAKLPGYTGVDVADRGADPDVLRPRGAPQCRAGEVRGARAEARPSRVPSTIISRSNSASAARMREQTR